MLEILLLWQLCKDLRLGMLRRGYPSAGWYQFMLVALWIVGEVVGATIGLLVIGNGFTVYLCALAGAGAAAIGAFFITKAATPLKTRGPSEIRTGGFPVLPAKILPPDGHDEQ